ncbi:MAG TPA: hypothetical protein DCR93_39205, partial [Cytophagales bacterium]|nr:hypothetical protein [Cytophagales bacterium]
MPKDPQEKPLQNQGDDHGSDRGDPSQMSIPEIPSRTASIEGDRRSFLRKAGQTAAAVAAAPLVAA